MLPSASPGAKLCPGTVAAIIIGPEDTLRLLVLITQIKTVDGFPIAILVPQHNQNLSKIISFILGKTKKKKSVDFARIIPFHGITLYTVPGPLEHWVLCYMEGLSSYQELFPQTA